MSFTMKANKGNGGGGEKAPEGNHPAVLVGVFDLGTQHNEFNGKASWRREVYLVWELPTKKQADGKSFLMATAATLSLNEKATLRKWVEGITGKKIADGAEFDFHSLFGLVLGKPCLLNLLHNDKGYPRVEAVAGFPDGLPAPTPTLPLTAVSFEEFTEGSKTVPEWVPWAYNRSLEAMSSIPDYIRTCKEITKEGVPVAAGVGAETGETAKDDPIPF